MTERVNSFIIHGTNSKIKKIQRNEKENIGTKPQGKIYPPTIKVVRLAMMQIVCNSEQPPVQPPTTEMGEGDDNW